MIPNNLVECYYSIARSDIPLSLFYSTFIQQLILVYDHPSDEHCAFLLLQTDVHIIFVCLLLNDTCYEVEMQCNDEEA